MTVNLNKNIYIYVYNLYTYINHLYVVIGGALSEVSLSAPLYGGAIMSLLGLIVAALYFENPTKKDNATTAMLTPAVNMSAITIKGGGNNNAENKLVASDTNVNISTGDIATEDVHVSTTTTRPDRRFTSVVIPPSIENIDIPLNIETSVSPPAPTIKPEIVTSIPSSPPLVGKVGKKHVVDPMPRMLYFLYLCQFFNSSAFAGYLTVFPLFIADKFDYGGFETGLFFTFTSAIYVIVQLFGFSRLVRKIGIKSFFF